MKKVSAVSWLKDGDLDDSSLSRRLDANRQKDLAHSLLALNASRFTLAGRDAFLDLTASSSCACLLALLRSFLAAFFSLVSFLSFLSCQLQLVFFDLWAV